MVFLAGCTSEPKAILDAVRAEPDLWQNQCLVGAFIPGVNNQDFSALGRRTAVRSIFATPGLRPGASAGTVQPLPLHYSAFWSYLAEPGRVDVVYTEVPLPAEDGTVGLGLNADFCLAPIEAGAKLVGIINPRMPDVRSGPRLAVDRFCAFVEDEHELPIYDAGPVDPAIDAIGKRIVSLLRDGDTLQLGLGKVQAAVLQHLGQNGTTGLAYHSGMLSTPIQAALDRGIFSRGITTGTALGSSDFYDSLAEREEITFSPVKVTHAQSTFARMERFISVNSVIEVDLYGQANGEFVQDEQVSGHGGLIDFMRGARQSRGGLSILALPSTGKGGKFSRIVPSLSSLVPVTVARSDVDMVITEHGIADLRYASTEERAEKLISIADPAFRGELQASWTRTA